MILSPSLFPPGHFRPFASFLFPGVSSQWFRSRQVSSVSLLESTRSFLQVMSCPGTVFFSLPTPLGPHTVFNYRAIVGGYFLPPPTALCFRRAFYSCLSSFTPFPRSLLGCPLVTGSRIQSRISKVCSFVFVHIVYVGDLIELYMVSSIFPVNGGF
jgi:hypothetical protein